MPVLSDWCTTALGFTTRPGPTAEDPNCQLSLSSWNTAECKDETDGYCCEGVFYESSCHVGACGCYNLDDVCITDNHGSNCDDDAQNICHPGQCPPIPSGHVYPFLYHHVPSYIHLFCT